MTRHETDELVTARELATLLRCSPQHVRNLCAEGRLPAVRYGKVWRIWKRAALAGQGKKEESA
jgi:excisionase family DNA binding protein